MMKIKIALASALYCFVGLVAQAQLSTEVESQIDSIISVLTMEEKVAMCHAQSKFSTPGVPRLGLPEIWMSDGPHGVRGEISWDSWSYAGWTNDSITAFPALTCLAASFNEDLSYQYGVAVGEEARFRKKDILLGPGVNIYRTPLNGRNFEYMGEDPYLASQLVVPYIQGLQTNGVAACVKHYVLNNQELWRDHINVEISDRALYEIYLPAFKAAIVEGEAWSIMSAYNQYQGQYCSHNEKLNNILKTDWGFDGVVVTDWGAAHDTKQAALYGLDIEMGTGTNGLTYSESNAYENYFLAGPFKEMLAKGEVPMSVLDDKARRILRLMYRTNMVENQSRGSVNTVSHQSVARNVAREGVVLLKNENNIFPIEDAVNVTIAVIGENAVRPMTRGGGSSELKPKFEISPLQGIQERYKNAKVVYSMGYSSGGPAYGRVLPAPFDADSLRAAAVAVAKSADIVLFVGGLNKNHHQDCEGGDRLEYGLSFEQDELIEALAVVNSNLGMIIISGNAIEMPWLSKVKGLIQGWYLGSMTGYALADVISGDVNPSGKLPFSFPKELKDNSAHSFGEISYPGDSINQVYKDDILVGYRWHDTKKIKPQYAFGFGLSYSDFELSSITSNKTSFGSGEKIIVSANVKNVGSKEGAEVVQVYVGKRKSKVDRALKELKGYQKIKLTAGQSGTVEISIDPQDLAYYNESKSDWELEKGQYYIYVGNASNSISKRILVSVK
ncbi:MAG: glycoside hydrolase family 3 C-terminal domain-containing protein [Reichenbachiella sp.]